MGIVIDIGNFVGEVYSGIEKLTPFASIIQTKFYSGGGVYYDKNMDYQRIPYNVRNAEFKGCIDLEFEGKVAPKTAVPNEVLYDTAKRI